MSFIAMFSFLKKIRFIIIIILADYIHCLNEVFMKHSLADTNSVVISPNWNLNAPYPCCIIRILRVESV